MTDLLPHLVCAVMAGGSGTRFWPLSRRARPKQLLPLLGDRTLLRATIDRIAPLCPPERTLVVTARRLVAPIAANVPELPTANLIAEPCPRNTAPCLALAAIAARRIDPEAILCLLPADHHVAHPEAFRDALQIAARHAATGRIVTLGITPSRPETGFGYIEMGSVLGDGAREVIQFVEKPDFDTAVAYITGGSHLWNGGIFVLRADVAWAAVERHLPAVHRALTPLTTPEAPHPGTEGFDALLADTFSECPSVSIDYGIMEHRDDLLCVPLSAGWSDVGTWGSLRDHAPDAHSFVRGDVVTIDSADCVLLSEGTHISVVGLRDLVVAATPDAVLVMPISRSQQVRDIVALLAESGREELL